MHVAYTFGSLAASTVGTYACDGDNQRVQASVTLPDGQRRNLRFSGWPSVLRLSFGRRLKFLNFVIEATLTTHDANAPNGEWNLCRRLDILLA
jgi:hypothetical protein